MRLSNILFAPALAALALQGCGGGDTAGTAVPRQYAYPRIDMSADTGYVQSPPEVPLVFPVSTAAVANCEQRTANSDGVGEQSTWLTLDYPAYGATLYCTFLNADSAEGMAKAIDNRRERMMLNLNGAAFKDTLVMSPDGFSTLIVRAPHAVSTPLQFIAEDGERWVVSGSLFFANPPQPEDVDSVAPIVDAVYRHLVHGVGELARK